MFFCLCGTSYLVEGLHTENPRPVHSTPQRLETSRAPLPMQFRPQPARDDLEMRDYRPASSYRGQRPQLNSTPVHPRGILKPRTDRFPYDGTRQSQPIQRQSGHVRIDIGGQSNSEPVSDIVKIRVYRRNGNTVTSDHSAGVVTEKVKIRPGDVVICKPGSEELRMLRIGNPQERRQW
ncbi:hypothetical protein AOCH_000588 [Aspergillus ochraceoroseus]|uniref:Uncharacterized protein n=1 Tax=Aspergillus ochraceoroseus TaxID=138278 RepID=A0A0F8X5B5_9EURO|nr:hypothetical protein AOCH_000588 [Aspergillus ochraceoroseus]